jgi:hypothetical protein
MQCELCSLCALFVLSLCSRGCEAMECARVDDVDKAFLYILEWRGTYDVNFMLDTFEINKEGSLRDEAKELAERCLHTHKDSVRSRYISELFNIEYAEDVDMIKQQTELVDVACLSGHIIEKKKNTIMKIKCYNIMHFIHILLAN